MTDLDLIERITRSLAFMLRHQPETFDLDLDEHGFADIPDVVRALNERLGEPVVEDDLHAALESGDRVRYEVQGQRIRALYGHSIPVEPGPAAKPPELLFVAIPEEDMRRAQRFGLRGGRRRFLHLALSDGDARESGRRIARVYTVLTIRALDAWEEGVNFYDRTSLWLADEIPTHLLEVGETHEDGRDPIRHRRGGRSSRDDDRDDHRRGRGRRGEGRGDGRRGGRGRREEGASVERREDDVEMRPQEARTSEGRGGDSRPGRGDAHRGSRTGAGRSDGGREGQRGRRSGGRPEDSRGRVRRDERPSREEPARGKRDESERRPSRDDGSRVARESRLEPAVRSGSNGGGSKEHDTPFGAGLAAAAAQERKSREPKRVERKPPPPAPEPAPPKQADEPASDFGAGL